MSDITDLSAYAEKREKRAIEAFKQGVKDHLSGLEITDCPFDPAVADSWMEGWIYAWELKECEE